MRKIPCTRRKKYELRFYWVTSQLAQNARFVAGCFAIALKLVIAFNCIHLDLDEHHGCPEFHGQIDSITVMAQWAVLTSHDGAIRVFGFDSHASDFKHLPKNFGTLAM